MLIITEKNIWRRKKQEKDKLRVFKNLKGDKLRVFTSAGKRGVLQLSL